MAENFAEELTEHGFTGVVIDLKNITHDEFKVELLLYVRKTKYQCSLCRTLERAIHQTTVFSLWNCYKEKYNWKRKSRIGKT